MNGKISNFMQVASVRRYEIIEGSARGVKMIDCDNGNLRFIVNESMACDIVQMYHKGQNVSFISKNGVSTRKAPFANSFEGGMLYTCGLDSVGAREGYAVHGTFHSVPALVTRAQCDENGIIIEAEICNTELFGKNLVVKRTITSDIGGDTVKISDTLINRGYLPDKYCVLYHINVGYPMLDDGVKIVADVKKCTPRTDWSKQNDDKRSVITAPNAGEEETCYFLECGTKKVSAINEKLKKTFTVEWSGDTLPCLIQWKSMACGDYALGLEPSSTFLDDKFAYSNIAAGESKRFEILLSVTQNG